MRLNPSPLLVAQPKQILAHGIPIPLPRTKSGSYCLSAKVNRNKSNSYPLRMCPRCLMAPCSPYLLRPLRTFRQACRDVRHRIQDLIPPESRCVRHLRKPWRSLSRFSHFTLIAFAFGTWHGSEMNLHRRGSEVIPRRYDDCAGSPTGLRLVARSTGR